MIKQLIPILLASAIANATTVTNTNRDNANISSNTNLIQQLNYDSNDELLNAKYYQVKEFNKEFRLQYDTTKAKGYHYLYIDTSQNRYTLRTDYYFANTYIDGQENNFTFSNISVNLRGYMNYNANVQPYIDEYYGYYSSDATYVNNFINAQTYTIQSLDQARTTGTWTQINNTEIDLTEGSVTINYTNKALWYKFTIIWAVDEIWNANDEIIVDIIPNILVSINPIYSSSTLAYYWTIEIEYTQEVIDIPGLLFTILGMPFAWISTAFNVTLFSGTPYAINISRIFFELICGLILIVVLRKVIK